VPLVRIRDGSATDLPALPGLFRRSSLSNEGDRDVLLAHPEALELTGAGVAEGRTRVAAAADDTILGFITTLPVSRRVLEIEDLFVDPDWMRSGVARHLVEDLVAAAGRSGVDRIEVTANPHASAFYRHVGFIDDHETETPFGPAQRMSLTIRGGDTPSVPHGRGPQASCPIGRLPD
jgi:GNAT superfamily N-acetyltransferase